MANGTYTGFKKSSDNDVSDRFALPNSTDDPKTIALFAEALHKARFIFFPQGYFSDASWQILLELFIAKQNYKKVIITDLCLEPKIPASTVLRHLERTVVDGYVRRLSDPHDKRKIYVCLTEHGDLVMTEALSHVMTVFSRLQQTSKKLSVFL